MKKSSVVWEPLFVAEPKRFEEILADNKISRRLSRWPGYEDMLLGEALRLVLQQDAEAGHSLHELYRFGLQNGLLVQARRDAVAGLRLFTRSRQALPFAVWRPFLQIDPDRRVACEAVEAWLAPGAGPAAVSPLLELLRRGEAASRGGTIGGLLRQGLPDLAHHLAEFRDALTPEEFEDALWCCGEAMPTVTRRFLGEWFDCLEEDDLLRRDLLMRVLRRPEAERQDHRHVAARFLPPSAEVIPIRRPHQEEAVRQQPGQPAGRVKQPD